MINSPLKMQETKTTKLNTTIFDVKDNDSITRVKKNYRMYRVKPFKVMSYQETVTTLKYKNIMKMAEDLII